jgi:hypothetical protein
MIKREKLEELQMQKTKELVELKSKTTYMVIMQCGHSYLECPQTTSQQLYYNVVN